MRPVSADQPGWPTSQPLEAAGGRPFLTRACGGGPASSSFRRPSPSLATSCSLAGDQTLATMGFFSGKKTPGASSSRTPPPPPPAPARQRTRERLPIPVHQARWHHEHQRPLPYPDVTLPHDWHLDPNRIPVPAVPRSHKAHMEEVHRRRAAMTAEQRAMPEYAADSPYWAAWFAFEHEEQRRRGVGAVHPHPPPPPVVMPEEEAAEAEYQKALAKALADSVEDERRKAEEEEAAYQQRLAQAMALSVVDAPPSPHRLPPPPTMPELEAKPALTLTPHAYAWTGEVPEFVSAPPVWLGATPQQEAAYLNMWRATRLAEERRAGEQQMLREAEVERERAEEEREREEERARQAQQTPAQQQQQTPEEVARAAWNAAFGSFAPAPPFVDLTGENDDDDDAAA